MAAGDDETSQCSCVPHCHECFASVSLASGSCFFNWVSVPSTQSVAVDRALPSRVSMIEFVCSAVERLEELGKWDCSHDFFVSDAKDRA